MPEYEDASVVMGCVVLGVVFYVLQFLTGGF